MQEIKKGQLDEVLSLLSFVRDAISLTCVPLDYGISLHIEFFSLQIDAPHPKLWGERRKLKQCKLPSIVTISRPVNLLWKK